MEIIDKFLPQKDFKYLQDFIMGPDITWHIQQGLAYRDKVGKDVLLTHMFYQNEEPHSPFVNEMVPLLEKLDRKVLIRLKANAYPITDEIVVHPRHTDLDYECKTALFYINTNDGWTELDDGTKVDSVENRLVVFDSQVPHSSTSCTDAKVRYNININYF